MEEGELFTQKNPNEFFILCVNCASKVCFYFVKPEDGTVGVEVAERHCTTTKASVSLTDFPCKAATCSVFMYRKGVDDAFHSPL